MKIDFTQPIYNLDGSQGRTGGQRCPVCGHTEGETQPLTMAVVAAQALVSPTNEEREKRIRRSLDKKERGMLALRIYDAKDPLDLETNEIAAIKEYVEVMWPPVTVAQADRILEGKENPFKR